MIILGFSTVMALVIPISLHCSYRAAPITVTTTVTTHFFLSKNPVYKKHQAQILEILRIF